MVVKEKERCECQNVTYSDVSNHVTNLKFPKLDFLVHFYYVIVLQ